MTSNAGILEQIIEPEEGGFSPELARYVLSLHFPDRMKERYLVLAEKAQQGALTPDEEEELEEFIRTDSLLAILKSKARVSLRTKGSAA